MWPLHPQDLEESLGNGQGEHGPLLEDAVKQQMKNSRVAFQACNGNIKDFVGHKKIACHLVFDMALLECFRRKARFAADGRKVSTPPSMSCSAVVSRDSVRISLLITALNDLDALGCNVQNAFPSANDLEKHCLIAGDKFGHEKGKIFTVVEALHGLKSASAAFRSFMAERLDKMNFVSSAADPDVWLQPAIKPCGSKFCERVLCHVNDVLAIGTDPRLASEGLKGGTVKFENDKIKTPEMNLGAKLQKKSIDGISCWAVLCEECVKAAANAIEALIPREEKWSILKGARTPMNITFVAEPDDSREIGPKDITSCQEMIGMLQWATESGQVDILHEISILSQHQAPPRANHMKQLLQIFSHLERKCKLSLCMDHNLPAVNEPQFLHDTSEFLKCHQDAEEELPRKFPRPRGKPAVTTAFVDASHAANEVTCRSHSGHISSVDGHQSNGTAKGKPLLRQAHFCQNSQR